MFIRKRSSIRSFSSICSIAEGHFRDYRIFGATVSNGNTTFTVGFANRGDSTSSGSGASPAPFTNPNGNDAVGSARGSSLAITALATALVLGFFT